MDKELIRWLKLPPKDWDSHVQKGLKSGKVDFQNLDSSLRFLSARCAMLSDYIAHRAGTTGCGPATHEEGIKQVNKTRRRVRKALDYTMPSAGEFTF